MSCPRPLLLAALALLGGCASADTQIRSAASLANSESPRRIGLLPLAAEDGDGARLLGQALGSALGNRYGASAVALPGLSPAAQALLDGQLRGELPVDAILDLSARHGVDAVLIGRLTHYRPYPPQAAGLDLSLVSCRTGAVLWSALGEVDLGDAATRSAVEGGLSARLAPALPEEVSAPGHAERAFLIRQSPTVFADFVAETFVASSQ